jgi:hypothetical protein
MRNEKRCKLSLTSTPHAYGNTVTMYLVGPFITTKEVLVPHTYILTYPNSSILNQQTSPFLQLSAEIRNIIYSYALGHRTFRFKDAIYRRHARLRPHEPHVLALLRVCHQIYSEASLFPYSLNVFSFRDFEISFKPFLNHRQLAHFRAITTIELVTYQAGRMWAAPELFSRDLDELKVLERLPNLREVRVVVDLNMSLYVERAGGFDFNMIWQNQKVLTDGVRDIREDVLVRFFWA